MCSRIPLLMFVYVLFFKTGVCQEIERYDVIIHEIYADPTPSHGLPPSEFIEIRNISSKEIDLKGFSVNNGNTNGKINYSTILKPDSLIILCSTSSLTAFSVYGRAQSVSSFPSLSNEMDTISIIAPNGITVHAVNYDLTWYRNELKQEGGWSLEMIRIDRACLGKENWSSSIHPSGGTPGKPNSNTTAPYIDQSIQLSYAYMLDSATMKMVFNRSLAPNQLLMEISLENNTITKINLEAPLYNILTANLTTPIERENPVSVSLIHGRDCLGQQFQVNTKIASFSDPEMQEEILNEILFNPDAGGNDYVEWMNKSQKTYDLGKLYLANRNSSGRISSVTKITDEHWPLFPNSILVFTEDCEWLKEKYHTDSTCWCFQLKQMPSLPDESGNVLILNAQGKILDELNYDEKWHNKLVFNKDGVALERILPAGKTNDPMNWYSASSQSGYGTPGSPNSQNKSNDFFANAIELSNPIVSPNNDGRDDFVLFKYQFPVNGYIANIWITDTKGQVVKIIGRNELCGITGHFRWDGLDEKGNKVLRGNYIVIFELFHLSGTVKRLYKTVSVFY